MIEVAHLSTTHANVLKIMKIHQQSLPNINPAQPRRDLLPTNLLGHHHRVQRWANFIAGFSVEFVEQCLSQGLEQDDLVLDPFLGCGTTLVTARNLGYRGVGYDRHPVFYYLAKAKLSNYDVKDLDTVKNSILTSDKLIDWAPDAWKFLFKLFAQDDLVEIQQASCTVSNCDSRLLICTLD